MANDATTRKGLVPPPTFFRLSHIIVLEAIEEAGGCTSVSWESQQASPYSRTWAGLWCPFCFSCGLLSSS